MCLLEGVLEDLLERGLTGGLTWWVDRMCSKVCQQRSIIKLMAKCFYRKSCITRSG